MYEATLKTMPNRCRPCWRLLSVRTGTVLAASNLRLLIWVQAIYLEITSRKGISSIKLHRDTGISQTKALFMPQRIREAFRPEEEPEYEGPVEVDEAEFGGTEKNEHTRKRMQGPRPRGQDGRRWSGGPRHLLTLRAKE